MRGRCENRAPITSYLRNTPAHAGKIFIHNFFTFTLRKHPRACGEDLKLVITYLLVIETPPRMRGR